LTRSRAQSRKLHERFFQALNLGHIQLDELWANVKQAQHAVWVWTVCDSKNKNHSSDPTWSANTGYDVFGDTRIEIEIESGLHAGRNFFQQEWAQYFSGEYRITCKQ